jgi:hypothetical protein
LNVRPDTFEDMLYTAAADAGWLTANDHRPAVGEIPEADIVVRVTRPSA